MKIALSATAASLDAELDPRFGRCACFLFVDTDDSSFEAIDNRSAASGGGAGVQAAQLIVDKAASVVLTGNCGPKAAQILAAAGIEVVTGCHGQISEVVEDYTRKKA